MLQFQLWKKLLVALVMLGGVVYALPNLVNGNAASMLPGEKINLGLDLRAGLICCCGWISTLFAKSGLTPLQRRSDRNSVVPKFALAGLMCDNSVVVRLRDEVMPLPHKRFLMSWGRGLPYP